jgi:short-subunit dehydrogenase
VADRIGSDNRLALLINNAGFGVQGRFWEASLESQTAMHELHIMTTHTLTHAALQNLVRKDFGGIINVASVASFVRTPGSIGYSATKTWMTSFTEGLYLELKQVGSNVTVQALCPGYTYSEFHDRLRANRSKLAPAAFWLTSEEVVDASLEGLRTKKLFVIPNWRYRALTSVLSKLPTAVRLAVEMGSAKARQRRAALSSREPEQLA